MDIKTNSFCASGMFLPNGSYATFGGNDAVTTGGGAGSQKNTDGATGAWDATYQDFDGRLAIRILNPLGCKSSDNQLAGNCAWYDEPGGLQMKKHRWYSTAEATGTGEIVIIGGFVTGGYINRWYPNVDPVTESGSAEPTYEYFPARPEDPKTLDFYIKTSGLNAYPHTFLMPSGKMFLQANLSTALWDHDANEETPLPAMPNGVVRVYPASGAVTMLPLTPANNYTPTILFCGGATLSDEQWGDYTGPFANTWDMEASKDCQRITPEPTDGSAPAYIQDDDMPDPRTMGQFILLPNGKVLLLNGGRKGTAGYAKGTKSTPDPGQMPFGTSLCSDPVFTPAIYDPNAPKGSRWSSAGFSASPIPRLYHSSAILLPDGSVIVAGSNPNPDVNLTTVFNTEYRAEVFYPPYFSASNRPAPQNVPTKLSYGGSSFDITLPATSYTGSANDAADKTTVTIVRSGFTTHAMNMGQRYLQLNNTYTVNKNGSITLHVAQLPPNPNLFQPGPAFLYVNINDIPSTGKYLIVGNGQISTQPTLPATQLQASVKMDAVTGGGSSSSDGSTSTDGQPAAKSNMTLIIGGVAGGLALLALLGIAIGICAARRKKQARSTEKVGYGMGPMSMAGGGAAAVGGHYARPSNATESTIFAPLNANKGMGDYNEAWDSSTANLNAPYVPYKDDHSGRISQSSDYDPYASHVGPQQGHQAMRSYDEFPSQDFRR
ncbi:copper radical oxidase [Crepidotus variabilis]|uniref:Copper radical oxidase n=1 Tax=Crepidotus variabilis TaxID=179855 RepID=A0A9P6JPY5_9AGAR|nr:copper radical oxidase [Crepidotus variabilis]